MSASKSSLLVGAAMLSVSFMLIRPANGATVTLNAIDSGWYKSSGEPQDRDNQNYAAGWFAGQLSRGEYRDFVVFNLSSIQGTIISAELRLYNPGTWPDGYNGFMSDDPSETYRLFEVTTDIATLIGRNGGDVVFEDLADGTLFGTHVATDRDNGRTVSIELTAEALSALSSAAGLFAFGGAIEDLDAGAHNEVLFANTPEHTLPRLVVTTAEVPLPPAFSLLAWALLGALSTHRSRVSART